MIDVIPNLGIPAIVFDPCRTSIPIAHRKDTVLEA